MNECHIDLELSPRDRLMNGFAYAIAEKGYIDTTIADIVRYARVSKRTFYQHFVDKKDCLLHCYHETSLNSLEGVQAAIDHARGLSDDLQQHLQHGVMAFLTYMRVRPRYMQILMSEVLLVDQNGIQLRRDIMNRFSHLLQHIVTGLPFSDMQFDRQPPLITTAMVGAINELVLVAFEHNQPEMFDSIQDTIHGMLLSLLQHSETT
jgi:AcrR family transcriptional regulator